MVYHVLNRGVGRMRIFRAEKDYNAFQQGVEQTLRWPAGSPRRTPTGRRTGCRMDRLSVKAMPSAGVGVASPILGSRQELPYPS